MISHVSIFSLSARVPVGSLLRRRVPHLDRTQSPATRCHGHGGGPLRRRELAADLRRRGAPVRTRLKEAEFDPEEEW